MSKNDSLAALTRYPLLDSLRYRRSRRFGLGMEMQTGPLAYRSQWPAVRLTEEEEALLAFAACGVTGPALAELDYSPGEGGTILAGLLGRTVGSGDAIQAVSVFVTNEDATYLLKRPRDFEPGEIPELVELARKEEFTELYRRSRVTIKNERAAPPLEPLFNLPVNQWSLYDSGSSYFLPVNELTLMTINGLLAIFDEPALAFIVDERAGFQPAGLRRHAKSRGGHLSDDPREERTLTIQQLESLVTEFVTVEQGMVLQNLALMAQAMGLGGFPHWAAHPFGWLKALGFRMRQIPASQYLGMGFLLKTLARLLRRDPPVGYGSGLERDGKSLLVPFCPPYHASMEAAVRAVVELKFGDEGIFRAGATSSAWKDPERVVEKTKPPSDAAIEATIAYCDYVFRRYGRFPAYQPPFRTVLGFQVGHVDVDFYEKLYKPGASSQTQLEHMGLWHPDLSP